MYLLNAKKKIVFCAVLVTIKIVCFREIIRRLRRAAIISCHYVSEGNVLPSAEDFTPPPDAIFFHETSCSGGMTSRQACAVESVARIHPEREIYVYFNSPVSDFMLKRSCLMIFSQFKNVKLARLHTIEYAKGTVLGEMLARRENSLSTWPIQHTADMLRFVTLYKYGGVYLDTDLIVVKSLDALGNNWVAKEDEETVNVAAMAFSWDEVGRNLVSMILKFEFSVHPSRELDTGRKHVYTDLPLCSEIKNDYQPNEWTYNGSGALERSLQKLCNTSDVQLMAAATCHGFEVYEPEMIYPIHWEEAMENATYFVPGDLPKTITDKAYTHHLWNMVTSHIKVEKDSPFDKLARKHCPTTRKLFGTKFGL